MKFNISPIELINSGSKIKILRYFMQYDVSMSEREIAAMLNLSHTHLNRSLKELARYNMVSFITTGRAHLWKINRKSYGFRSLSGIIKNIALLETPLEDLKKTLKKALPKQMAKKIVLFGSVSKGSERIDSDIDLFVLVDNNRDKQNLMKYIDSISNQCLDLYGNRLSAYVLTEKEFNESKNSKILDEIKKGTVI